MGDTDPKDVLVHYFMQLYDRSVIKLSPKLHNLALSMERTSHESVPCDLCGGVLI